MKKATDNARHEVFCTICQHRRFAEIERAFIAWESPTKISKQFKINVRSLYRHVSATGLAEKRERNVRAVLADIILRGARAKVGAMAVIQAIATLARLDSNGKLINRNENMDIRRFTDWSDAEIEDFVKRDIWPKGRPGPSNVM